MEIRNVQHVVGTKAVSVDDAGEGTTYWTSLTSKYFRINHSELFAEDRNHINGIENLWNQAKRHMRKFNGVPKAQFGLYLKECE